MPAMQPRLVALTAGPFHIALPIPSIRQILDMGGASRLAPTDPRALGVEPISLARVLGAEPLTDAPALLLFDGHTGPVLLSVCRLEGVFEAAEVRPLPPTVATRWPDLVTGTTRSPHGGALLLVLDPRVLMGVVEARLVEAPDLLGAEEAEEA